MASSSHMNSRATSLAPSRSSVPSLTPSTLPPSSTSTSMLNEQILTLNTPSNNESLFAGALEGFNQLSISIGEKGKMKDDTQEDDQCSDVTNSKDEESSGEEEEEERGPTPNAKRNDLFADWDNGEPLTPEERAQLMKISTYERAREMNICRRWHMEADLTSEFRALTGNVISLHSKPAPTPHKCKTKVPVANKPPHCSSRTGGTK
jgi:hypothetical protein